MTVSRDLDAPQEGQQVLLFCRLGDAQTAVVAQRHWFEDDGNTRRLGWRVTWDGAEVPKDWTPYAWAHVAAPEVVE